MKGHSLCATALRILAVDAIEAANSGHPGVALGLADVLCVLWRKHLAMDAAQVQCLDRDHFILSNGHASALYYALLHLAGFALSIDDLKQFRSLGSKTPGHPERDTALGIDVATGPLGQGLANAVGIAAAKKYLAKQQACLALRQIYAVVGDGCLMEGISHEACALAASLGLNNLVVVWDDNGISIDGDTKQWFAEDVIQRFNAYGWHVIADVDGHDPQAIDEAFIAAKKVTDRPCFIAFKTRIGWASDWEGQAVVHGKPLGKEQVVNLRERLQWSYAAFEIPQSVYTCWSELRGQMHYNSDCSIASPTVDWQEYYQKMLETLRPEASRVSSKHCLSYLVANIANIIGGSADLSDSTGVMHANNKVWQSDEPGNFIHFGVREFAMFAIANGMAAVGMRPYVSTFLVFADYGISAIRMAALMRLPVTFVLTHDSVALGEDGPTHQPIEQLAHLRAMPNVQVWRPCDRNETMYAWQAIMQNDTGPSCLVLSRQTLPIMTESVGNAALRGAYRLVDVANPRIALLASGSEVAIACEAQQLLAKQGVSAVVISVVCMEMFFKQPASYQALVLPQALQRVAIEAGSAQSWYDFNVPKNQVLAIDSFGASGKGAEVLSHFGIHVQAVVAKVLQAISQKEKVRLV